VKIIRANAHKYPVLQMCKVLKISRSTYYSYKESEFNKDPLNDLVVKIFNENQHVYGTRKLKVELAKLNHTVSRRRIARIMRINGLVSAYTIKKYRPQKDHVNNENQPNIVDREFDGRSQFGVIVSDLTYVRVGNDWNYICVLLDLHNREIVGYSCGRHKDAQLVYDALATVKTNLKNFSVLHTDRGSEFKNYLIDGLLKEFNIKRSLSAKGCPYDNAVAEAQFKIIKTEFVRFRRFECLEHLRTELAAYVYWFNNKRIHGTLGYKSPAEFKQLLLQKTVQ
jgi:putative transposase